MLSDDVLQKIFQYSTWQDGAAVSEVCSEWHSAYKNQSEGPEWASHHLSSNDPKILLRDVHRNGSKYFAISKPPNLVLFMMKTTNATFFRRGAFWTKLQELLDKHPGNLLPSDCTIVCLFAKDGIITMGKDQKLVELTHSDTETSTNSFDLSITLMHLPNSKVVAFHGDRQEIAAGAGTLVLYLIENNPNVESLHNVESKDYSFIPSVVVEASSDSSSFLFFGSNYTCTSRMIQVLQELKGRNAIVGGIFPYTDEARVIAYRSKRLLSPVKSFDNELKFAATLSVAIIGETKLLPVVTKGFSPCSTVLKCQEAIPATMGTASTFVYRRVVVDDEVLHPLRAMERYGVSMYDVYNMVVIQSSSKELLEIVEKTGRIPQHEHETADVEIIHMHFTADSELFCTSDQRWSPDKWAQLYSVNPRVARDDIHFAFNSAFNSITQSHHTEHVGCLLFVCNARGEKFFGEPNVESRMVQTSCPRIPVTGCFCGGEVGPQVLPGGYIKSLDQKKPVDPSAERPFRNVELQGITTCGAMLYWDKRN